MRLIKGWRAVAICAAAIIVLLSFAYAIVLATMPWLLLESATADMTPVCLKSSNIAGTQWLSIPKAYLPYGSDRRDGELKGPVIYYNYKDLSPWSLMPTGTPQYPIRSPQDDIAHQDNYANLIIMDAKRVAEPYEPLIAHKSTSAVSPFPGWKRRD